MSPQNRESERHVLDRPAGLANAASPASEFRSPDERSDIRGRWSRISLTLMRATAAPRYTPAAQAPPRAWEPAVSTCLTGCSNRLPPCRLIALPGQDKAVAHMGRADKKGDCGIHDGTPISGAGYA